MGSAGPRARLIGPALFAAALSAWSCAHRSLPALPPPPQPPQPGVFHRVRGGETLFRIARTYEVPIELLARENALADPAQLEEGSRLFVPGAARELEVPPPEGRGAQARIEPRPQRRALPTQIPRAGAGALDPLTRGAPLAWPTRGVLISGFGERGGEPHDGIDLAAPEGTPVVAAREGTVLFAGEQKGYGKLILLDHGDDLITVYAHNAQNLVGRGARVERGEAIARVGRSGNATGPHLHFEVRLGSRPRDPLRFLR